MACRSPQPPPVAPPLPRGDRHAYGRARCRWPVSTVEQIARSLRQAGDAGRRVTVVGSARNVGTTYAAISLARALANEANMVLVDLAFGAPNLSVISTDPQAPGIAELIRGAASFGDIITRDNIPACIWSRPAMSASDAAALAASPMLATVIEALVHSYDHVVIDVGLGCRMRRSSISRRWRTRAVLVAADPAAAATRAARERLIAAGFGDVTLLAGGGAGGRGLSRLRPLARGRKSRAQPAHGAHRRPQRACCLMARLPTAASAAAKAENAAGRDERQKTVEQRLGVAAEQVLVVRLADAEIESVEAALAAVLAPA